MTGSAGSTGTGNCAAHAWISGFNYQSGAVVTGTCNNGGGGATVCTTGKNYAWSCSGSTCAAYAPGADGWWANWTPLMTCD